MAAVPATRYREAQAATGAAQQGDGLVGVAHSVQTKATREIKSRWRADIAPSPVSLLSPRRSKAPLPGMGQERQVHLPHASFTQEYNFTPERETNF